MSAEVKVRLSAEGEAAVVAAFRKVSNEAILASKKSAGSFDKIGGALSTLKGSLAGLGLTIGAGALVGFIRSGADAADAAGKLSQKVGDTTENVSALVAAGVTADVTSEQLEKNLGRLAKRIVELKNDVPDAAAAFGALGLKAEDFDGKGTAEVFALIAQRMGQLKDSTEKTALAIAIFGKAGASLIPLLNDLSEGGLERAKQRARELGILFDDKLAAAAQVVNDDFALLAAQARGMAAQFVGGLAPAIHQIASALQGVNAGEAATSFQKLGEVVGFVAKIVLAAFDVIATGFEGLVVMFEGKLLQMVELAKLNFAKVKEIGENANQVQNDLADKLGGRLKKLFSPVTLPTTPRAGAQSEDADAGGAAAASSAAKKREDILAKSIAREKSLRDLRARLANESDKREYEKGAIDLEEYFRRREEIIRASADAEIAALTRQRNALGSESTTLLDRAKKIRAEIAKLEATTAKSSAAAIGPPVPPKVVFGGGASGGRGGGGDFGEPSTSPAPAAVAVAETSARLTALRAELETVKASRKAADDDVSEHRKQLDAEITKAELERDGAIAALAGDQIDEATKLADARLGIEDKIAEAQGNRHAKALHDIDEEVAHAALALAQAGTPTAESETIIARLRATLTASADFDDAIKRARDAADELQTIRDRVQSDVEAGSITALQGEALILKTERDRLPVLQQIAAEARAAAAASGDPERINAAEQFSTSIRHIGESADSSSVLLGKLRNAGEAALQSGLFNFLTEGIDKVESFGEAMRGLASTVVDALRQVTAQILTTLAIKQLEKAFGLPFAEGGQAQGKAEGGIVQAAAAGGLIRGPGTGTSDSIAKTVPAGTVIVKAKSVRSRGVLPHLRELVRGAGASTSRPRVPVRVSNGEFELPPQVHERRAGMLEHLLAINEFGGAAIEGTRGFAGGGVTLGAGSFSSSAGVRPISGFDAGASLAHHLTELHLWRTPPIEIEAPRLAAGGIAQARPASARVDGDIRFGLNSSALELLVVEAIRSPRGQAAQIRNVRDTRNAHREILG